MFPLAGVTGALTFVYFTRSQIKLAACQKLPENAQRPTTFAVNYRSSRVYAGRVKEDVRPNIQNT